MTSEDIKYEDLENIDVITVELIPERKGLILKHCEYFVSSRRHGTTVTRRYNEFVQLHEVLCAKYPYRAISRLPPKRVVVGGGSTVFLQRRRSALQRWLTLIARHPVLAYDADLRVFLCETGLKIEKCKHDEFMLAGTQESSPGELSMEELQTTFLSEQEQLRIMHLGLGRLNQIFERVESRNRSEQCDIRELGACVQALTPPAVHATDVWTRVRHSLTNVARIASEVSEMHSEELESEDSAGGRFLLALDALGAFRDLCSRLSRGLHAERAAAAATSPYSAASHSLRSRHRYALTAALHESKVSRAYALNALQILPALFKETSAQHGRSQQLWAELHRCTV